MKLFVDSANLKDIEEALARGFPSGVTTNPSILSKEERRDFKDHMRDIIALLRRRGTIIPLSVELFTTEPRQMLKQAEEFVAEFGDYEELTVKVPIGWDELQVIHEVRRMGVKVNCTCCMSYNQAVMASLAGANYVSLFWGRIRDTGSDAAYVVRQVHQSFKESGCSSEIIVGSIRQMMDVSEAWQAGADIVTVPPQFFRQMCSHPKTDEAVAQFIRDFTQWSAAPAAPTNGLTASVVAPKAGARNGKRAPARR